MNNPSVYSTLFTTLYDEESPIGHLGRGSHYSLLRAVEWLNISEAPLIIPLPQLKKPKIHDFAIIWDEDHDTRIINIIEGIYMAGLLSPIQFIGERKGTLTVILDFTFYENAEKSGYLTNYLSLVSEIAGTQEDPWTLNAGVIENIKGISYDKNREEPAGIIHATKHRVVTYLKNIDTLWNIGLKDFNSTPSIP